MSRRLQPFIILVISTSTLARSEEPDLPLCPTNIDYFPQSLPMHCRLPRNANFNSPSAQKVQDSMPNMQTLPPSFFQSPSPDKQPQAIPFPVPPSFPALPPGFISPPASGFPAPMFPPGMPIPMGMPTPGHKLPVIVMPFYSPDPSYKKSINGNTKHEEEEDDYNRGRPHKRKVVVHRKKHNKKHDSDRKHKKDRSTSSESTDTDTSTSDTSDSDSDAGWWKRSKDYRRSNKIRRRKKQVSKPELLTPVIQYVTKDGYVIYEKEISKNEARDWLDMKNNAANGGNRGDDNKVSYTELDELNERDKEEMNVARSKGTNHAEPVVTRGPAPIMRRYHRKPAREQPTETGRVKY